MEKHYPKSLLGLVAFLFECYNKNNTIFVGSCTFVLFHSNTKGEDSMQKNTEYIPNRDAASTAVLQHLDGLRGIDTHCHHLPDDQFQNMGLKF